MCSRTQFPGKQSRAVTNTNIFVLTIKYLYPWKFVFVVKTNIREYPWMIFVTALKQSQSTADSPSLDVDPISLWLKNSLLVSSRTTQIPHTPFSNYHLSDQHPILRPPSSDAASPHSPSSHITTPSKKAQLIISAPCDRNADRIVLA